MNSPGLIILHMHYLGIKSSYIFDQLCDKGVSDDIMNITDINNVSHKFDQVPWP